MNITDLISDYRDASVILWNEFFRKNHGSLMVCGSLDDYEIIQPRLFSGLVLKPLRHRRGINEVTNLVIHADPKEEQIEVMLGEQMGSNYQWSSSVRIPSSEFSFEFVELFEFDRYGEISLPLVKCKMVRRGVNSTSFDFGLIEFDACRFIMAD